ncbi:IS5 family transposase [Streptomyces sp. NBC_00053]|uniref:IS5 family transposase n=1 Tax=unclassified Streptomyces TaxID=2593676 RepID=UPI000F5BA8D1|nr:MULTISPECIES: IS5 family transposase [unclassified Streptomyces]WSG55399.1 IS5 family transposase [Streptomyces sp. NBC_01732]WSX06535.1 IS5 family transposase [Streptomyces sp. NBC_00987]MCX4391596.1 IS5 family transposase [Streptomyces sp. NBC_01767]MCX5165230.1 IS5 family transposase [Streptomyces sp. NBC_00305]MCX5223753.1 IS5 family transposase [Streptomyces sp. NBC_00264]
MTDLVERLVPDELWVLFRRVVPPTEMKRPQGGGRRRAGDREALATIVFVATSGCTWRQLPPVFGPCWQTVDRRFAQWSRDRVWARLHRVALDELGARGELEWSRCAIDSVSLRAAKGGPLAGPNPTDRGKAGSKIHLIVDRNGLPLSLGVSGANMHGSLGLEPLVRGIPPIRSRRGPRRRRPGRLHADKGYDYDHLRGWLRKRGIRHRSARKGIDYSQRLGRHRWVVERTVSWPAGCWHLHRRYERKAEQFLALVGIAAVLIGHRRLTRS